LVPVPSGVGFDDADHGVDDAGEFRRNGERQIGAEIEPLGAHADDYNGRGVAVHAFGQVDDGADVDRVRSDGSAGPDHLLDAHVARPATVLSGIDEHDETCGGDFVGKLGCQLVASDDGCTREQLMTRKQFCNARPDCIVTAQCVAVPNDEHPVARTTVGVHRANSSTIAPSGPISCSRNAIWPRA
jgi:hypothetical protein